MPSVEDETADHLYIAEQNRNLALVLLGPAAERVRPHRADWAGIVAFYSAVHYVNAFLWEVRRSAPTDHRERNEAIRAEAALQPIRDGYRLLRMFAFEAKYAAPFAATEVETRELLEYDLRAVEAGVLRALGLTVPTWQLPAPG